MHSVHKRPKTEPEIAYFFFKCQTLVLYLQLFEYFTFEYIPFESI